MKVQLFLCSALCLSILNAMETPPRAVSPHERAITILNFDSDLANRLGAGNLQLMLTNRTNDTLETRCLLPEDYTSLRIITGHPKIDENPEQNKLYTRFFLEKFPEITVKLQQWQESRTPGTTTFSVLPTIDIQPLLTFLTTVQEIETAVDPAISRLKSPRSGDSSGNSSPRSSFRNTPRTHNRLTRASDSLSDDEEYKKLQKQLSESNETLQNQAVQQRVESLLTQLQTAQDEQKKATAEIQKQQQENTAFKAKFNFTGRQLTVSLSTTVVATAVITSLVVVKLLR